MTKKFQLEARGQEPSNQWNNDLGLELQPLARIGWELLNYGWFGSYFENIQSDPTKEARGQSWPWRPPDNHVKISLNHLWGIFLALNHYFIGLMVPGLWPLVETFWSLYIDSNMPRGSRDIPHKWLELILTWLSGGLRGQLWPLASFVGSDWIFSK